MKIKIGVIQKPFGIRGEVKVKPMTDNAEARFKVGNILELDLNNTVKPVEIESVRQHQGSLLIKFVSLDSLNDVEFYHQGVLSVNRDAIEELEDDEFYFTDIINFEVLIDGNVVGVVSEVMDLPAHPVLRIKTNEDDVLVPFVDAFIETVDTDNGRILVKGMAGLL